MKFIVAPAYIFVQQISDIADGLDYLHSKDIVHANLKTVRSHILVAQ
jgi:enhancing lycopene biosynthesis protein 2